MDRPSGPPDRRLHPDLSVRVKGPGRTPHHPRSGRDSRGRRCAGSIGSRSGLRRAYRSYPRSTAVTPMPTREPTGKTSMGNSGTPWVTPDTWDWSQAKIPSANHSTGTSGTTHNWPTVPPPLTLSSYIGRYGPRPRYPATSSKTSSGAKWLVSTTNSADPAKTFTPRSTGSSLTSWYS